MLAKLFAKDFKRMPQELLQPKTDIYREPAGEKSKDEHGKHAKVQDPDSWIK